MKTKGRGMSMLAIIVIGAVLMGVVIAGVFVLAPQAGLAGGGGDTIVNEDMTSTVNIKAYDKASDSNTQLYPVITVTDGDGNILVSDTAANSTTANKGDVLGVYGTGTTYYCVPKTGVDVSKDNEYVTLDCWTAAAEGSMTTKIYNSDQDELTADDNASNEADYTLTLGSDEVATTYVKIRNGDSDSMNWLGMVCTFANGDIDDFEITDANWVSATMPKEVDDATIAIANDSATDFTGTWKHCYVPKSAAYVALENYEDTGFIQALVTADNTDPAANTGDNFGVIAIDYSYNLGADGVPAGGVDDLSENGDVGNMGAIDEGTELIDAFTGDIVASVDAA